MKPADPEAETTPDTPATGTGPGATPAPAPWWRRALAAVPGLFPAAQPVPRTVGRVGLAIAAVLVGTAASLLRTTGTGPLQSIWEEDARDVLNDALMLSSLEAITKPAVGYYIVGPRLLGELATVFPVSWAAAVLSISSALITALFALAVYVASGAHLTHPLARLLVSVPLLTAPVAENLLSEIYNRPVCLHFFGLYAVFWMLLWTPTGRAGRLAALAVVAFTAFSSIVTVFFIPLALLRVAVRRDRLGAMMLGLLLAAAALNAFGLGGHGRGNISPPRLDPIWAAANYVIWAVPNSLLGFRATADLQFLPFRTGEVIADNIAVIVLPWVLIGAILAAAAVASRRGLIRPAWPLAVLAATHSAGLLCLMIVANGSVAQRYLLPVELLLFVAIVALLRPAPGVRFRRAGALLVAFAVLVAVASAANYRWDNTYRHAAPRWTDQIDQARAACRADHALSHVVVRGAPKPWWSFVVVPCHELRRTVDCPSDACRWLDPPTAMGPKEWTLDSDTRHSV